MMAAVTDLWHGLPIPPGFPTPSPLIDFPKIPTPTPAPQIVDTALIEVAIVALVIIGTLIGTVINRIIRRSRNAASFKFLEKNPDASCIYNNGRRIDGMREMLFVRKIDDQRPHGFSHGVYVTAGRRELSLRHKKYSPKGVKSADIALIAVDIERGKGYLLVADSYAERCRLMEIPNYVQIDKNAFVAFIEQKFWGNEFVTEQDVQDFAKGCWCKQGRNSEPY